jgi:hypothetical protein
MQALQLHTARTKCFLFKRGLTLKFVPMSAFAKHRIEEAKERLRNKLTYEYIISLPKYKKYTKEQYEKLIENIESLCLVLLESYCKTNNLEP